MDTGVDTDVPVTALGTSLLKAKELFLSNSAPANSLADSLRTTPTSPTLKKHLESNQTTTIPLSKYIPSFAILSTAARCGTPTPATAIVRRLIRTLTGGHDQDLETTKTTRCSVPKTSIEILCHYQPHDKQIYERYI